MNKTKLKAILVDDEVEAIYYLKALFETIESVEIIGAYTDLDIAIENIVIQRPDILFLDVQMPKMNGFELLQSVSTETYMPTTIFTTAFAKYAIEAIKNSAFDFLLKPVNKSELDECIKKVIKLKSRSNYLKQLSSLISELNQPSQLKFNTSTGFVLVDVSDIVYCEAHRNYCEINLTNDRKEIVTSNLNNVHKMLPEKSFFRISRFYVINLKFLMKVERKSHHCFMKREEGYIKLKVSSSGLRLLENHFSQVQ